MEQPAPTPAPAQHPATGRWVIVWIVFGALMFQPVWPGGQTLFSTDDNIGALAQWKNAMPYSFFGGWDDAVLAGSASPKSLNWTNIWLWLTPVEFYADWIHAADLILASLFLCLFLRERGVGTIAATLASLTAFWLGSNFTLVYAGHTPKFAILMLAALYLWLVERAVVRQRLDYALLAGGAMGMMFLEQVDVALFFALFLGPYALYALWREKRLAPKPALSLLVPMLAVSLLLAARPIVDGYRTNLQGASIAQQEDEQARWDFATQWSWPPEETIDFLAPGYMGWRSGEPSGPYWGRMGRSADWEHTRQGFANFKLENHYLGAIPLVFAFLAGLTAFRKDVRFAGRSDALFWTIATGVALLLAFGKYFPLYRAFFHVPLVGAIRNPNKFLHIVQLALGILAAYGLDRVLRLRSQDG